MLMENRFNRFASKIDKLLVQAEEGLKQECDRLPERLKAVGVQVDDVKAQGNAAWKDLRPGLENAWSELSRSVRQASSHFRARNP